MSIIYAAYGSNMSQTQMAIRCPESRLLTAGWLPGFKLVFDSFSSKWNGAVADVETTGDSAMVPVVLYDVTLRDLDKLDDFEGYPTKYNRRTMKVITKGGQRLDAQVYYLMNNHKGSYDDPSASYFKQIRNAYIRFKFPVARLEAYLNDTRQQRARLDALAEKHAQRQALPYPSLPPMSDFMGIFDKQD
jgi:gamma-glutamylcyclotransferase (GGCT)/AIG2-like uncharacterized protein YtfP